MSSLYRELVGVLQAAGLVVVYDQPKLLRVHKFLHEEVRGIVWEFYHKLENFQAVRFHKINLFVQIFLWPLFVQKF